MREKIEEILKPAINVNAPYAKQMVNAILEVFQQALCSPNHAYSILRDTNFVYFKQGDVLTSFSPEQARHLANLLNDGADIIDGQKNLN
jgi:hypothetical protein